MSTAKTDSQIPQRFRGEWETKRLGEIGEISGAGVDKKVNPNEEPVRLVNYLDVYNKTFLYSSDLTHEVSARRDQVRRCAVEKGDVFFTPSSEVPDDIGCSAVAVENISDGVYSYHVVRLRLKIGWDLYFRAYVFDTKAFLDQASKQCEGSGTRYVISLPKFRAMTVRFPPAVEEQRAIAEVLSDVDGLLNALDALIAKKRAMKQATMQQLLTGKTRLPGFSGTWMEKLLSDLAVITMGQSPSSTFYNLRGEGLPLIQGNADIENRHTIERVWSTQGNKRCNLGDLVLTVRAPVGAVAVASKNAFIGRGVCSLKPVGDSRFLLHALVHAESRWQTLEQGSTFTAANSEQVGQFHLHVPDSVEEQHAIASVLSDMDAEIAALEQRRDKTRAIKQGMMQQLLTGRVRLSESRIIADDTD